MAVSASASPSSTSYNPLGVAGASNPFGGTNTPITPVTNPQLGNSVGSKAPIAPISIVAGPKTANNSIFDNVSWSNPFGNAAGATNANLSNMGAFGESLSNIPNLGSVTNGVNTPWGAGGGIGPSGPHGNQKTTFQSIFANNMGMPGITQLNNNQQNSAVAGLGDTIGGLIGGEVGGAGGATVGAQAANKIVSNNLSSANPQPITLGSNVTYGGASPDYLNNTAEQSFRQAYLKSLNPNTNFDINAQNSPFKANTLPSTPGLSSNIVSV